MNSSSFDAARTSQSLLIRVRDTADQQAWDQFYERYAPMIEGWCRHWFPREVDDMVQEVMRVLVRRLRTFEYDPAKLFRGYLKTVTCQLMSDLKKRAQRWPMVDGDGLIEDVEATVDLEARLKADYDLELLEKAKEIVRARVEPRTWLAYLATAEEWRKPAEVARELGMKVGAAFQAKYCVITHLRREIENLQGPL
jgi:RNA polymerase sigma factor (sigma-70 family)